MDWEEYSPSKKFICGKTLFQMWIACVKYLWTTET